MYREDNPECWDGHEDLVNHWRRKHPDYQRQWRRGKKANGEYLPIGTTEKLRIRKPFAEMIKNGLIKEEFWEKVKQINVEMKERKRGS